MTRRFSPRRKIPHVLGASGRVALRTLAGGSVLLAFDFDGTLAPIEQRPQQAAMSVSVRTRLRALACLYPCVVISGRAHRDLRRRLRDVPLVALAGSHGAEGMERSSRATKRPAVRAWAARLRRKLRGLRGVDLESKPHGLALHYRRAEDKESVRLAVLAAVAHLRGARHIHGKDVIEVVPLDGSDKGKALAVLRSRWKPRATLYVGDDLTDEDAFRSRGPGRLISVRVAPTEATSARYRLDAQHQIEALLDELLRLAVLKASPWSSRDDHRGRNPRPVKATSEG
jgi:trehalose 6-phosphate phosphatase